MPFRAGLKQAEGWFIHLLHLDDSAHRIALGAAIGVFIAFTPTIGFQMLLVLMATSAVRANKIAGLPMPWITNPVTILPVFSLNYMVGHALVGGPGPHQFIEGLTTLTEQATEHNLPWIDWVRGWWRLMIEVAGTLWVGSVVVGLGAGVITYAVMYYLITVYRRHHRRARALRQAEAAVPLSGRAPPMPGPSEPAAPASPRGTAAPDADHEKPTGKTGTYGP